MLVHYNIPSGRSDSADTSSNTIVKLKEELKRTKEALNEVNEEIGPREVDSVSNYSEADISDVEHVV